ncbi:MAG TPA: T9SS type A sorting domain-containing protein [Chitinophagaceae bacterium]|nr:T9SS type A sorting domain-containing protein [Chitinophagaceae bacterium]
MMKKTKLAQAILLMHVFALPAIAQTINRVEYFFNTDPGFGNGITVSLTPAVDLPSLVVNTDISSLPIGIHRLFIRSQRSDGAWSLTNSWLFYKSGQLSPVHINRMEYFFDNDPGFGNGTAVTITPASNIANLPVNANIASLGLGLHTLFLRTQDNSGSWSQTVQWLFYKASFAGAGNVTALEYFFDSDPGFGNGIPLTISPSTDLSELTFNISVAAVSGGTHRLYVRSRDAAGNWSISNVAEFQRTIPLPVTWKSFVAEKRNAQVYLEWQTENEVNNDRYEVEHSLDGLNYHKVATTPAQSGPGTHKYSYLHHQPDQNVLNYYRIKQIDVDGKFTWSATRTVRMDQHRSLIVLTPNPASNFIEIRSPERNITVKLFNLEGRQVQSALMPAGNGRMNITGLAAGSYLAVIEKNGKLIETIKVVKQ